MTRQSIRAFLPTPVPRAMIEDILSVAARAPSGTNTQPWKVTVLTGAAKERLSDGDHARLRRRRSSGASTPRSTPTTRPQWVEPYLGRRRKIGWDLYGLLGIGKTDKERMHAQHGRNYAFFDAPVGMIFTIDRMMEQGSWLDYGMFLENIMVAARARGLDTCPQAAFTQFHRVIKEELGLAEERWSCAACRSAMRTWAGSRTHLQPSANPWPAFARFLEE